MEEPSNSFIAPKSTDKNVEFQQRPNKCRPKSKKLDKRNSRIPLYLNPPPAMVVFVKPNGKVNPLYRIVGFSLDEILMNCTKIMKLTSAARKLYSNDGQLVDSFEKLASYDEVFVSLGEPFIDPIKLIKQTINIKAECFWGLNGLYIPKTKRKAISASPNHKSSKVWRILTFANREFSVSEAIEIISDLKDIDEVKAICSSKHNFNGRCKRLFTSDYTEIYDLKTLPDEESFVWNANNDITILGPIWASKGEDLNQEGVYNYFLNCKMSLKNMLNESRVHLRELEGIEKGDLESAAASKIKSFSKPELKVQKEKAKSKIEKIEKVFQKFKDKLHSLPKPISQVITEPDKDMNKSTYKSTKGLRLKVYQNGQDASHYLIMFFNVHKAKRGINDSALLFSRFLDYLSENVRLSQLNDFSKGILARRVFTETGEEIKNVDQLSYDQLICVSYGDDWIDPIFICACADIHLVDKNFEGSAYDFEINSKSLKEFEVSKKCDETYQFYNLPIFQHQKRSNMFLVSTLTVKDRKDKKSSLMTSWMYTAKGRMILRSIPSLCLTLLPGVMESLKINKSSLTPQKLETGKDKPFEVNMYPVQLCLIQPHEPNQIWHFNNSGLLINKGYPGFCLTYFENRSGTDKVDLSEAIINSNIIAAEMLPEDLQMYQRWAFKQESFGNLNQWRLCDLPNPEWHKTALTWPLKSDGELNIKLTWPIEGLLVPCVPPLTRRKYDSELRFPIKLMVFKNNDHTMKKPIPVAGPDLSKLMKKGKDIPQETHCTNETLLKLEFQMFLDHCTNTLKLPSAARRLFDQYGDEKFDLEGFSNSELVYVSMGELWCSPAKTLSRIELRSYSNRLSADIERMRFFLSLQLVNDELVIGIKDDSLEESGQLEIQLLNEQSNREIQRIIDEDNLVPIPEPIKEPSIDETLKYKTFHEKNCDAAKLRLKSNEKAEVEQKEEVRVEKISKQPPSSDSNLQQFVYKSNKILVMNNQRFCLCADDVGKPVIIKALSLDIDNSRSNWILHNSGSIESMHYRGYVLAVRCHKMLHFQDKAPPGYLNCILVLEKSLNTKYGRAHQRFKIDARSGLLYPFETNSLDKGITAALLSGICTKFVTSKPLHQPGFLLEINSEQKASCLSCVGIMSGRFPQSSLDIDQKGFVCCHSGGFKVINKTADLSSLKSEETYNHFVNKLEDIRKQLTVKICKGRYMVPLNDNIQVLLHLNGDKKLSMPRKVTGKSISQIMEMATGLFNLQRPVRILYTLKGEEIYDDLSFRNIVGQVNPISSPLVAEDKVKQASVRDESVPEIPNENLDSDFNISLSDDQRFFIIEFIGKLPSNLYTLQINIVSVNGINIFQELHAHQDSAFLFNYEIFNNQINTELFVGDLDFEGEQTELSIKSSQKALIHLFTKIMTTLRLQLISARVNKVDNSNEFQIDIESIDALADFHFDGLSNKLQAEDFEGFSMKLTMPLLSAETFMETTAYVTLEVTLNQDNMDIPKQNNEKTSTSTGSVITEPGCISSDLPIELWASVGEPFVVPGEEKVQLKKSKNGILFQQIKLEIDKKKFLLRTMKGERLKKLNSGTLEGTPIETNPVKIKDNWQFPTINEIKLSEEIEQLQNKLNAMRNPLKGQEGKQNILSRNLYKQRNFKKVLVHLNGERENTAVPIWCECIWDILQNSATPLGMKRIPKYIFKRNGKEVSNFNEISTGETLTVSLHSIFVSPKDSELQCEIKANWGRSRRMYGENSTDLTVQYRHNTVIDIDPFGPPDIMKQMQEIPAAEPKTISVYENGQLPSAAKEISGRCLLDFLKSATSILGLSVPVKCLYAMDGKRITGFKEILHDDFLAASVTGKGFLESGDA